MTHPCPECGADVEVPADILVDEIIECDECAVELQVTALTPLSLAVYEEAEK
jgi:alpha-aminoadipate/glutamate carrier protein LysW